MFDRTGQSRAARRLLGIGLVSSPPALLTGWADWLTLNPQQRPVGLVHAFANATGLGLLLASYRRRRTRSDRAARLLAALEMVVLGGGGAIGGDRVYNSGARVEPQLQPSAGAQYDSSQLPDALEQGQSTVTRIAGVPAGRSLAMGLDPRSVARFQDPFNSGRWSVAAGEPVTVSMS